MYQGHAPGADEATSIATLLDLATSYGMNPPKRSVLLLATTGHANNLAGLREAVWALTAKKKELASQLAQMQDRVKKTLLTGELLERGTLGSDDPEHNTLVHKAIQDEIRNEIEILNTHLRLARKDTGTNAQQIKTLAQQKLILRRLSWEAAYHRLTTADQEEVRRILPASLNRIHQDGLGSSGPHHRSRISATIEQRSWPKRASPLPCPCTSPAMATPSAASMTAGCTSSIRR